MPFDVNVTPQRQTDVTLKLPAADFPRGTAGADRTSLPVMRESPFHDGVSEACTYKAPDSPAPIVLVLVVSPLEAVA